MLKNPKISKEFAGQIDEINDLKKLVDTVGANLPLAYTEYQELLEETHVMRRYDKLAYKVVNEIQVQNIKEELQEKIRERVDKNQRDYILREEMKLIREELGDDNTLSDADEFKQACDALKAPKEVKEKIEKEIKRFKNSMGNPAESGVTRTYIETMLEMPWDKVCKDHKDIAYAEQVLNEDHYGLEKVKERVLEFLAVRALTKKGNAPILCLVGPPGTGKTSIAKSLARALKKPYVRISLGGVRDEAEIRGHRKTYVGAMPGRIATALRTAGVKNPLLLLDEIDKVSNDYKGDTFSALLEVLDSEQNKKFRDHYLEVPLDLSGVLFVTTANTLQTIPRPLLDRMEVIEINSYTENEKLHIATEHLIPKQLEKHGLKSEQLTISKKAIWKIARNYTKEAGVRQLERKIGDICRKSAREILKEKKKTIHVTERNLHLYLGKELYIYQMKNEQDEVGIVRGLAWTSVGGDTLEIEVNVMPGEGEILLTGQLGDVMKESARTGISYIRSVSKEYGIDEKFFKEHDIHIHIPEGATPKDGPSAGITMATAMLSAITEKKVRADIAMTGEITLRGRVLPIGGLKEKLLAAKNAGIKTVLVPKENETDVEEISAEITKGLEILPVSHMSEVLKHALIF
jgi:ATP-dependent Lon protease